MEEPRWLDADEMRAWRELLRSHSELLSLLDRELEAEHGLSLAEYEVLSFLSEAPDQRMRMSELARNILISPSALTRRLDRLERRGLVNRERCPHDARGSYAVLSPKGRTRLVAAAPTHLRGVRRHYVDRLTPAQLQAVATALEAVPGTDATARAPDAYSATGQEGP